METVREKPHLRLVKSSLHRGMTLPSVRPVPARSAYYRSIEAYAQRIRATNNITDIIDLLDQALTETRALDHPGDKGRTEHDIRALKNELEHLRSLVYIDHLTGLLNRGVLADSYAREAARADRAGTPLTVALLDIDDFKALNDRYGHQTGDLALTHIANIIRETMRPSDIVMRYGGEEFLFLLPDASANQAVQALRRVQSGLNQKPLLYAGDPLCMTFSAGVTMRKRGESHDTVVARADAALYAAKRAGKRQIRTKKTKN